LLMLIIDQNSKTTSSREPYITQNTDNTESIICYRKESKSYRIPWLSNLVLEKAVV
jgi:hypothetical protein